MAFPGSGYLPPGVLTQTSYDAPLAGGLNTFKLPVIVGEGSELLVETDLHLVRGSSANEDQKIVDEDAAGHAVASITPTGVVNLSAFDGTLDKIQVRHYPIVDGKGNGAVSNKRDDVSVKINGKPIVVRAVSGANGVVQLAQAPLPSDVVRVTYSFKRTDTLVTDDVSAQVPNRSATIKALGGISDAAVGGTAVLNLHGDITNTQNVVVVPANNTLTLGVDGVDYAITIPPKSNYTMAEIATAIRALNVGSLTASTFVNQVGQSALTLQASNSLAIKGGSAVGILGFVSGMADMRTVTFYTFNGPIVDGGNGGRTTTDPGHVTVKVDGKLVIPTSVNGATRAVTLPVAPKAGAKVTIQYYFNTWQDTFDYLANIDVTAITKCGNVPGGSTYVQGSDFILQNDKILWGTAATVQNKTTTLGSTVFDSAQISTTLVDNRTFLAECSPSITQSGGIATEAKTDWVLPYQPTLGNGRNTPLGQSLFQTISNGRIDLPVNRPDVVWAYWGYDLNDALARGRVDVLKVDGLKITLSEPVPTGAKVFATFFYNTLTDETYKLTVQSPGVSGVGTYTVQNSAQVDVLVPTYNTGSKGAGLTGVVVEFPSGSELSPDFRFEVPDNTADFVGPVEETVTVQFANRVASLARFTFPGQSPYEIVSGQSDHLALTVHGTVVPNVAGLNLSNPSGMTTPSAFATLVGSEIVYGGGVATAPGMGYDLANEKLALSIDGVDVDVTTKAVTGTTVASFVSAINEAASGHQAAAVGGGAATITLAANASDVDGYYVGWNVVIGNGAAAATAGQVGVVTGYVGSTQVATVSGNWAGGAVQASDPYYIYNPATRAALIGTTKFDGPFTIATNKFSKLLFVFKGFTAGSTGTLTATISNGAYATASDLATAVSSALATAVAAYVGGHASFSGLAITCSANGEGQLEFKLQLPGTEPAGYLQFLSNGTPAQDFCVAAGLSTDSSPDGLSAMLVQGPVAYAYTCSGGGIERLYDRLVIRNRVLIGAGSVSKDAPQGAGKVLVKVGNALAGLAVGDYSEPVSGANTHPASVAGKVSLVTGQDTDGQAQVLFYDGTGAQGANNTLSFELDGYPVTATFTASANGTLVPLGPRSNTSSVIGTIVAAIAAIPGAPFGDATAIANANLVMQEGLGFRIVSSKSQMGSRVAITGGSALGQLGLVSGTVALATQTTARKIAAALNNHVSATFTTWMFLSNPDAGHFAALGLASVAVDATGAEYLYIQDAPASTASLGAASNISVHNTTGGVADALRYNTGLGASNGDGGVGDAAVNGYIVKSNISHGSGSVNTSMLSSDGTGQDGVVGQTYRDLVTGLTFTILPRGWQTNPVGPWAAYPTGGTATLVVRVSKTFTADANIPNNAIPGIEMLVANTLGTGIGDTAEVQTYQRGGAEPAVGDDYYVSYTYQKQDFSTQFYSKLSTIQNIYGASTPDNPVSLAAYLALLNGAVIVGIKQVPREVGQNQASITTYRDAIDELEGVLPGQVQPDIITLMRGDSTDLYQYLKRSCEIQSSIRYKAERTAILGVAAGTTPAAVGNLVQALHHDRMRVVYPDMATLDIQDAVGNTKEYLVDGPYLAAALVGSVVSPNVDVATPWTGRRLVGFTQLARQLDAVQQNQIAVNGVTILQDQPPFIKVRQGLTTDMTDNLTKLPTIKMIADEVQRQTRNVLESFIGMKFLPGILSQIEGRLSMMFKQFIAAQIITAFTGVKASVDPNDPTTADVSAWYSPVFPLLYILVSFSVRSSL